MINQTIVQSLINRLSTELSSKTVKDLNGLITAVMNRFAPDTVLNITLPKKVRPNLYIPSEDDIKALLSDVADTEMEVPIMLATFGALRRGEISALKKEDFLGNVAHISKTMVYTDDNRWVEKSPKSYAGDRYVAFPEFVSKKFMSLKENGVNMTPNKITSRFEHALSHAGIRHFRFHDLRHYNASVQHALGIPDAYIMQSGGWGNDRVLKEVYRHTLPDEVAKMNGVAVAYFDSMQHGTKKAL